MLLPWPLSLAALTGCAAMPDKLRLVASHDSHLTQHFGPNPTDYGYNAVAVELGWKRGPWFLDVSEGLVLNHAANGGQEYGAMWGPREIFQARTGLEISLR